MKIVGIDGKRAGSRPDGAVSFELPQDLAVGFAMSVSLVTLEADADLREVIRLFSSHAIRRLPLIEDGKIVGMLSVDDLLMETVSDLASLIRPVIGEVIFGHTPSPAEAAYGQENVSGSTGSASAASRPGSETQLDEPDLCARGGINVKSRRGSSKVRIRGVSH